MERSSITPSPPGKKYWQPLIFVFKLYQLVLFSISCISLVFVHFILFYRSHCYGYCFCFYVVLYVGVRGGGINKWMLRYGVTHTESDPYQLYKAYIFYDYYEYDLLNYSYTSFLIYRNDRIYYMNYYKRNSRCGALVSGDGGWEAQQFRTELMEWRRKEETVPRRTLRICKVIDLIVR